MTDQIVLRGIAVWARHGVYAEERERGQRFLVDVVADVDLSPAGTSDDLAATVDYGELARAVHERVAGERWDLIERVAERVAELVLEDRRVRAVEVTVHKPQAPMPVTVADVAVVVRRSR